MRIIAGSFGGRLINAGDAQHIRPTADRVREAMFNSLFSLGAIADAQVVDLFAGSGALGIEALSRGASHAVFVENDLRALTVLRENIRSLGLDDQATVVRSDACTYLAQAPHYDLALLDPPYSFAGWPSLLADVRESIVAIESNRVIELPDSWHTHRVRRYGSTVVTLAFALGATETNSS